MIHYVDPGKHVCGVAQFVDSRLVGAFFWPSTVSLFAGGMAKAAYRVVGELPRIYPPKEHGAINVAQANDLIQVAIALGTVTAMLDRLFLTAAQWKGQQPKEAQHRKMWRELDGMETNLLKAVSLPKSKSKSTTRGADHDIYDAVCLGLAHSGRI